MTISISNTSLQNVNKDTVLNEIIYHTKYHYSKFNDYGNPMYKEREKNFKKMHEEIKKDENHIVNIGEFKLSELKTTNANDNFETDLNDMHKLFDEDNSTIRAYGKVQYEHLDFWNVIEFFMVENNNSFQTIYDIYQMNKEKVNLNSS